MAISLHFQDIYEESAAPSHPVGTMAKEAKTGTEWIYLQAGDALTKGWVLRPATGSDGIQRNADIDLASAADTYQAYGTGDFATSILLDSNLVPWNEEDLARLGHVYWFWTDANATQGQGGPIATRTSDNAVDVYFINSTDGRIDTAFTTSTDFIVECSTRVVATTEPADLAMGLAQFAITDEYWFWALREGRGIVLLDTDDTAVQTDDRGLIPSTTTDGAAGGLTGTGTTAEIAAMFGRTPIDQDADGLVLVDAHCMWTRPWTGPHHGYVSTHWRAGNTDARYPRKE